MKIMPTSWLTKKNLQVTYPLLRRIIVLSLCFFLIATVAYNIWDGYNDYQTIIRATDIQTQGYARALKEHAERTFSEVDLVLQTAVRQIERAGGIDKVEQPDLIQLLRINAVSAPQIGSLTCIDRSGQMIAISTPTQASLPNVSNRQFYQFHRDNSSNMLFINPPFFFKGYRIMAFYPLPQA